MHSNSRIAWWVPLILLVIGPIVGVLLGALMNLSNGQVSAEYFSIVMWWDPHEVWLAAILQGMLEGGVLGLSLGWWWRSRLLRRRNFAGGWGWRSEPAFCRCLWC